jgi:hypothetical protein
MTEKTVSTPAFRKPALYFKLPSNGKFYPENSLKLPPNNELPVYPTTGLDEITIKTVDALFNGSAIVEVIRSCVPDIPDPWEIPVVDLDPLLVAIKLASFGNGMDIDSTCPECNESSKYGLNLTNILNNLKLGDYDSELEVDGIYVKFRPLKYKDYNRFNIQEFEFQKIINSIDMIKDEKLKEKKNIDAIMASLEMHIERITASIEYIKTSDNLVNNADFIREFLENCNVDYYRKIRERYTTLKESTQTKPLVIKCTHCSHEYEQLLMLNYCEYFRVRLLYMQPEEIQEWLTSMEKDALEIKNSALKMSWYMRGGISFNEILHLSDRERETINEIIKENLETTKKTQLPFF